MAAIQYWVASQNAARSVMERPFGLVDAKVAEANFFLEQLKMAGRNFFRARCYFSAFVSAARSVTFSLQSVMAHSTGFDGWYASQQERLRQDPIARFFNEARRIDQHIGINLVAAGEQRLAPDKSLHIIYHFSSSETDPRPPDLDVVAACEKYLTLIIETVFLCYEQFGESIDPSRYYTHENFARLGLSIEDAEEEVFGVRGWTDVPDVPTETRWQLIRDNVADCNINHLFEKYLGRTLSGKPQQ